jgi:cell envelope opacity-associated protein A
MKILVSFLITFSMYLYAADGISTNMDKKVYYDADRTVQDNYKVLSEELELFIDNKASEKLIKQYQNGPLKKSEIKIAKKVATKGATTPTQQTQTKEPGFFAKMLEKIGIGSTKKLPVEDTATSANTDTTNVVQKDTTEKQDVSTSQPTEESTTQDDTAVEDTTSIEPTDGTIVEKEEQ